jgi:hypothetical protein
MTTSPIDSSQRAAAKAAGLAYLITFATVVYVNFGIHDRLIVDSNPAETARNILAHETLFRVGILGDLIYCTGVIVLLTALYVILRPVSRGLALLAAFLRLVWVLMWLVMTLNLFNALRLLSGADYLRVFERSSGVDHLQLPVVQIALYPARAGCLRRDHVGILRGLHVNPLHFPRLRPLR